MITYFDSVFCVTAVGALMLPALMRTPKNIERMRDEVDEELQYRANRLLLGPGSERITDDKLWSELGGFRGAWSMVRQARLMNGIVTEGRKQGRVRKEDADALRDLVRELRVNFRLTAGEMITVKAGEPRRHARALAHSYIQTGQTFDGILSLLDGQSNCLIS